MGIELSWNKELGGEEGKQMQKRISGGAWLPVTDDYIVKPKEGLDVVTTIDMHLQDVASNALETQLTRHDAEWGVVVLMEVETGYIRAITNLKRFDDSEGNAKYYRELQPRNRHVCRTWIYIQACITHDMSGIRWDDP